MSVPSLFARLGLDLEKFGFLRGSLRIILAWPVAGLLLATIVWNVTYTKLDDARQTLLKNGVAEATSLSKAYAEQMTNSLEQIDQITLNLKYYWKNSGRVLKLEDQLREGLYPVSSLLYVTIVDRHGDISSSTLVRKNKSTLADRDYFLKHQGDPSGGLLISKPSIGRGSGKQIIRFSRRLNGTDGAFDGIVMVSVEPDYFASFHGSASLGANAFLSVWNRDGAVLVTKKGERIGSLERIFSSAPAFAAATGVASMGSENFTDREDRIVAWQAVANYPLFSVVGLSEREILLPLEKIAREYRTQALAISMVLLIFVLFGMFLSSRLAWRQHQAAQAREACGIATEGGSDGFFMWRALRNRDNIVTDFMIDDCNERGASMYEMKKNALIGRRLSALYGSRAYFDQLMVTYIGAIDAGFYEDDFPIGPQSPMKMAWLHRKMMRSHAGLILTLRDISDAKAHEKALSCMANSDALTALPNRHWMMGFLPSAIERARTGQNVLALLFVDLDDFKNINDTMGHAAGDELLRLAAARLRAAVRPFDHVVRLGGDEFTIILEAPENAPAVALVGERIVAALAQPFLLVAQGSHVVHASIGISIFPQDADDADTLLKHADIAMYEAKANGKASYQFFHPDLAHKLIVRLGNEEALRTAIDDDQFELYYQPRVDAANGQLCAMEALLRWNHPQRGLVLPGEFIGLAEETGLIVGLGELVIAKACAQLARWHGQHVPLVPVSLNVSPRQFSHGNIAELFKLHMGRHGIVPALVEIELTESCMMGHEPAVGEQLAALKALGVKLLIDDFGAGYSSLSQLQRLDFDILKIDKAFTSELGKDNSGEVFFKAIISMAHVLNIRVVAEGVETPAQLRMLQELQCDEIQGYFLSRPLSGQAMAQLMGRRAPLCEVGAVLCETP